MKTLLITGATGAVGSALVPCFLEEPDTAVRLLIRADSEGHLRGRLEGLCAYWGLDPHAPPVATRVEVFRGDVSRPLLGLEEAAYGRLTEEVTHVVHAAGVVKLNQSAAEARQSAVDPARHIAAFCRAGQRAGSFQKLEFVSTVGVAGRMNRPVPEEPLLDQQSFHNTYEEAKAEAERVLLGEMAEGLPATIHRPSMVVGDSRTGKIIHFQVFYHLCELFAGTKTWGIVPQTGNFRLDIIPSDYVARGLYLASGLPGAAGRILHLCSGPGSVGRLADMVPAVRRVFEAHGRQLPRQWPIRPRWLRAALPVIARCVRPRTRRVLQSLPFLLAYLDEEPIFENAKSREFFEGLGLYVPPVAQYLDTVLQYYCATRNRAPRQPATAGAGAGSG